MKDQITILRKFLQENLSVLSEKEIEILNYQINYLEECNEKFSKAMLELENDPERISKAISDMSKVKGVINV